MVEVADGAAILVIAGYFLLAYRRTFRARTGFVLTALSLLVTAVLSSAGLGDAAAFSGVVTFALLIHRNPPSERPDRDFRCLPTAGKWQSGRIDGSAPFPSAWPARRTSPVGAPNTRGRHAGIRRSSPHPLVQG